MIWTTAKTPFDAHTDPVFQNVGILKFHDIHLIQLNLFMHSYQNHTLPLIFHCKFTLKSQINSYNARNSCKFRLPFCRTRIKQFSVIYQGSKFYNTVNTNINVSFPFSFKIALKAFICNNYSFNPTKILEKSWLINSTFVNFLNIDCYFNFPSNNILYPSPYFLCHLWKIVIEEA